RLTIVAPRDGEQVATGVPVPVTAVGVGRFGGITDVQMLVDGQPAGESRLVFLRPPEADEEVRHHFEVTFSPGRHVLVVQDLTDPAVMSPPITVMAGDAAAGIAWVAPAEGAEFPDGRPISLSVEATDPNGLLFRVEFFIKDGGKIGESVFDCPQCRLRPGATIPHRLLWLNPPPGRHALIARAVRADGTTIESPVRNITVRTRQALPLMVVRRLPDSYEAGKPFLVRLVVTPRFDVAAYVIEELPPFALPAPGIPGLDSPFWHAVNISDGGMLDPLTGKVKFGPFLDREARTLTYELVPNMTVELAQFGGVGVADGVSFAILGDQELRAPVRHPADREPADDSLSASELTAYAAAWQREQDWPVGPNPIPVDYVTRAAALWKGGERYAFDPLAGPPPFCWSNGGVEGPAARGTAGPALLGGLATRTEEALPDGGVRVTIRLTPVPGVRAFAVEDRVDVASTVTGVTADGVRSPGGTVRWGPYFGDSPVEVTYGIAAGSAGGSRGGVASFDGQSVAIYGVPAPPDAGPRLMGVDALHDGSRLVTLESDGATPEAYELEASADLQSWTPVGRFSAAGATGFIRDAAAGDSGPRFYRAVRR
ncbi:MAG: hypothetical protein J0L84_06800, partial [Verrucomicrobia bacterium]|nr:hypothetical protein [Verrucomicrobiota bacterium]